MEMGPRRADSPVVMGACIFTGSARNHLFAFRGIGDLCINLLDILEQTIGVDDGFLFARCRRRVQFPSIAPA